MKIDFADKSYVLTELKDDKVIISIGATNQENKLSLVINTVELTKEDFKKLISDI